MADTAKAYAIDAAEGVEVHLDDSSEDATFSLSVRKGGAELEVHEGVTSESIGDLSSEHFSVEYMDPPAAPEEADGDADDE